MKKYKSVFTAELARHLLKKNYRIVDIKPLKEDPKRTIFIFENSAELEKDMFKFLNQKKKYYKKIS